MTTWERINDQIELIPSDAPVLRIYVYQDVGADYCVEAYAENARSLIGWDNENRKFDTKGTTYPPDRFCIAYSSLWDAWEIELYYGVE